MRRPRERRPRPCPRSSQAGRRAGQVPKTRKQPETWTPVLGVGSEGPRAVTDSHSRKFSRRRRWGMGKKRRGSEGASECPDDAGQRSVTLLKGESTYGIGEGRHLAARGEATRLINVLLSSWLKDTPGFGNETEKQGAQVPSLAQPSNHPQGTTPLKPGISIQDLGKWRISKPSLCPCSFPRRTAPGPSTWVTHGLGQVTNQRHQISLGVLGADTDTSGFPQDRFCLCPLVFREPPPSTGPLGEGNQTPPLKLLHCWQAGWGSSGF